ncbi:type VI immunity family protein [Roseibium sediminis]|uniref:type VI immunity family protein n=1 Tax=Roseibium sediminis TaxID=1775174 RepID=UPI00123D680F|nr:type VI immunity family protein [Roseibium sediminis]
MTQVLPPYYQVKNEYEKLDNLIINHERTGKAYMRFAFTVELWFMEGWTLEKRQILVDLARYYFNLFHGKITHYQKDGATRYSKMRDDKFPNYYELLPSRLDADEYFHIYLRSSESDLMLYDFAALSVAENRKERRPLSYLQFRTPLAWVKQDIAQVTFALQEMCSKLNPTNGVAGLSPVFEPGREDPKYYFPYLRRFPGFDWPNGSWGLAVGAERKIRGVNWLTILDEGYSRDLGGPAALAEHLGEDIHLHVYDGGVIIQAGPEPFLGDRNANIWPEHYRTVNRALKHLRFEAFKPSRTYLKVPHGTALDAHDESLKWLRRFDIVETE